MFGVDMISRLLFDRFDPLQIIQVWMWNLTQHEFNSPGAENTTNGGQQPKHLELSLKMTVLLLSFMTY